MLPCILHNYCIFFFFFFINLSGLILQTCTQDAFNALKLAAQYGLIDILKYLIEAGADVNENKMVCTHVLWPQETINHCNNNVRVGLH